MNTISAFSVSPAVKDWLVTSRQPRVLHIFDGVCNLINEHGEILSVVMTEIGNGPFNLVIGDEAFFEHLSSQSLVSNFLNQLSVGDFTIDTANATVWDPHPAWETLQTERNHIVDQVQRLSITNYPAYAGLQSPVSALLETAPWDQFTSSLAAGDVQSSSISARQLAGLGPGLTPTGDDFIMGSLHAAWIIHPLEIAQRLTVGIAETAAPLTTSLSAAWLRAAGKGEAGVLWHALFEALADSNSSQIQRGIDKILNVGATSGADALAGFIGTFRSNAESQKKHVIP